MSFSMVSGRKVNLYKSNFLKHFDLNNAVYYELY
jgi:hypothetical protein